MTTRQILTSYIRKTTKVAPKAKTRKVELTPAQKAARTKRRMGLDLSAIARKAVATRRANLRAAQRATKRPAKRNAKRAA